MVSENLQKRIDTLFEKDYRQTFYERIDLIQESEEIYKDEPYAIRYGKTLQYLLARMTIVLQEGEKITGSVAEVIPTEEQKMFAEELTHKWWNEETLEQRQEKVLFYYSYGWLRRRVPWFYSFGHLGLDWSGIIDKGIDGLINKAELCLQSKDIKDDSEKISFVKGSIHCYRAISEFISRYAEELSRKAEQEQDFEIKDELLQMAESSQHLSENPPRTFREALQLIWYIILVCQKVCGCGVLNLSRMDQYLYPYYQKDIDDGILTEGMAVELIEEFFYKNNEIMAPADHMSLDTEETDYTIEVAFDDPNYLTIGGLLPGNIPGVNQLSFLFIKAQHELKLKNPFMIVRWYEGIDEDFWKKVCAAIRDNATLIPYSDKTMIPALMRYGVVLEDVYDYGFFGCNDPCLNEKEGGLRQLWFNLARPLELALNNGQYPLEPQSGELDYSGNFPIEDRMIGLMTGPYYGKKTGDIDQCKNIDDLLLIYREQVRFLLEGYRKAIEKDMILEKECNKGRIRIEDCFLSGTVENGQTWVNGGTKYHKIVAQACGLATVADSFAAIDRLVFQEKKMKLSELVQILNDNYNGNEELRLILSNRYPKFGNDIEEADNFVKKVVDIYCEEIENINDPQYLYQLWPTISTDRDFTTMGAHIGATPDGRLAKSPISENQSPTEGKDINGLTALLNSATAIDYTRITGGPLNIKIHPSILSGEAGVELFAKVLDTFFGNGGMQLQINVLSPEQLIEAQNHPEQYKTLCVRVTGYSAYFVQMGKKAQDELIRRTTNI